jgi:hypothetical protein
MCLAYAKLAMPAPASDQPTHGPIAPASHRASGTGPGHAGAGPICRCTPEHKARPRMLCRLLTEMLFREHF